MSVHKKYRHGTIDGPSSVGPLSLTARSHGPIIQPQVFLRVEVGGPRRSDVPELRPHLVSVSVRARARARVRVRARARFRLRVRARVGARPETVRALPRAKESAIESSTWSG